MGRRGRLVAISVMLASIALAACGGGGGSSDPTVLRAGQIDIKLPEGYKVVGNKVVDETATTTPAVTAPPDTAEPDTAAPDTKAPDTKSGSKSDTATTRANGTTPTTRAGATATTKPSTSTIPLSSSSNPQSDMMTSFGKFRACLDRDGVTFIGGPDQSNPDSPTNDPDYLKSLSKCAAESNIVEALKSAQSAQDSLTPAQIKTQNKNYLKWRKCMIGRGWKIPEPKPDAQGRLITFGTGTSGSGSASATGGIVGPDGKDLLTSKDLSECSAKVGASISK